MEFVGEIVKADGETIPLYVNTDIHVMVMAYLRPFVRDMNDGDSIAFSRTK